MNKLVAGSRSTISLSNVFLILEPIPPEEEFEEESNTTDLAEPSSCETQLMIYEDRIAELELKLDAYKDNK